MCTSQQLFCNVNSVPLTVMLINFTFRIELYVILCNDAVYNEEKIGAVVTPIIKFDDVSLTCYNPPINFTCYDLCFIHCNW